MLSAYFPFPILRGDWEIFKHILKGGLKKYVASVKPPIFHKNPSQKLRMKTLEQNLKSD